MSRAQRRAARGSARTTARSRRTPVRARKGRGLRIPWIPLVVLAGVAGVIGLILYLILQANKPPSLEHERAKAAEADASADLPGEWVDVAGLFADGEGYSATAKHVREPVDYEAKGGLPPVGGDHWGNGECPKHPSDAPLYCGPAPWGFYTEPWEPASLVHNLEHAGLVVWYNTTENAMIDELRDFAKDNDDKLLVVAPLPDMEKETVAITSWSRRLLIPVGEYERGKLDDFVDAHNCRFDPEGFCG